MPISKITRTKCTGGVGSSGRANGSNPSPTKKTKFYPGKNKPKNAISKVNKLGNIF
jgi:hypothetical protein